MTDREKVINGLECCANGNCNICPYLNYCWTSDRNPAARDALALLKAQEPRVMPLDALPVWDGAFLVESRRSGDFVWASWYAEYELYGDTVARMVDLDGGVNDRFVKLYGCEWRCWTARPTDEQRKAVEWE